MIPEISVLCPCYNEEANVEAIAAAIIAELDKLEAGFEFVFIDNASTDRTVEIVKRMATVDPRIRLIVNTRNFGQMRSPTHGIYQTRGRCVLGIAADFQDPPALIPELVARWRAGAPIVLGTRISEHSSFWLGLGRKIGYGFVGRFGDVPVIPGATGFGIYDRKVVDLLAQWHEPEPFFRSMLVESGYRVELVPHRRGKRTRGVSSNTLLPMLDFAVSGLSGSAKRLLRLPLLIAFVSLLLSVVSLLVALTVAIAGGHCSQFLWAALIELNFALVFLFLGLIGDQVRLISERTRNTPLVVEKERYNFPPF